MSGHPQARLSERGQRITLADAVSAFRGQGLKFTWVHEVRPAMHPNPLHFFPVPSRFRLHVRGIAANYATAATGPGPWEVLVFDTQRAASLFQRYQRGVADLSVIRSANVVYEGVRKAAARHAMTRLARGS